MLMAEASTEVCQPYKFFTLQELVLLWFFFPSQIVEMHWHGNELIATIEVLLDRRIGRMALQCLLNGRKCAFQQSLDRAVLAAAMIVFMSQLPQRCRTLLVIGSRSGKEPRLSS